MLRHRYTTAGYLCEDGICLVFSFLFYCLSFYFCLGTRCGQRHGAFSSLVYGEGCCLHPSFPWRLVAGGCARSSLVVASCAYPIRNTFVTEVELQFTSHLIDTHLNPHHLAKHTINSERSEHEIGLNVPAATMVISSSLLDEKKSGWRKLKSHYTITI